MVDIRQSDQEILKIVNPASGEVFEELPCTTKEQLDSIVAVALGSLSRWSQDEPARREALRGCAKLISRRRNATKLATLLTQEQGKPFKESLEEVYGAAHWFATTADIELQKPSPESPSIAVHFKPLGVVAAITPWNFPLLLAASKVASALLAGNAVILKPSPFTPMSTSLLCELLCQPLGAEAETESPLPPGTLQVVIGGGELGRSLIHHESINKVSFTGSTKTGQAIMRDAADGLKRLTLELGGNDAAIVLDDVEIENVADKLFWGAFRNAGQFCVGIKRLYVHQTIFEPLVSRLVEIAEAIRLGDGAESGIQMGPVANEAQLQRVRELVDNARTSGARIRCGGHRLERPGFFFAPTIITDIGGDQPLVAEEQFGPALPVMPFSDEQEAIGRANATSFGLGGSVWTGDLARGRSLAAELECGTSWVNQHGVLDPLVPFGGHKQSGIGYENGIEGVLEYVRLQVVSSTK